MPIYKCKQCNTDNQVDNHMLQFICKNCGVVQKVPQVSEHFGAFILDETVLKESPSDHADIKPDLPAAAHEKTILPEQELNMEQSNRKNDIYYAALSKMDADELLYYKSALEDLQSIRDWKDAQKYIAVCEKQIERLQKEEDFLFPDDTPRTKRRIILSILAALLAASLIALVLIVSLVILPEKQYKEALSLAKSGKVVEAYDTFSNIDYYKDSLAQKQKLFEAYQTEKLKVARVGDTVYFGTYEQDNITANGAESIEWIVLKKTDNKLLLISRFGLACEQYHDNNADTTWEQCNLRQWLNTDFAADAFSEDRQAQLVSRKNPADANPEYETDPGKATEDKVFLLSGAEADRLFDSDESRICEATAYAVAKGCNVRQVGRIEKTACWYLRTPGFDNAMVVYVQNGGKIRYFGSAVNSISAAIRPAIWLEIPH